MLEWNEMCKLLEDFMLHWTYKNMHTSCFKDWGTVDCVTAGDPKQWLYLDCATVAKSYTSGSASASTGATGFGHEERWTFGPENDVYAKAVHLAWPALLRRFSNFETLGDIVESILGVRNYASHKGILMEQQQIIQSVCHHLSRYVNLVYQFTEYTETTYEDIELWKQYVSALNE